MSTTVDPEGLLGPDLSEAAYQQAVADRQESQDIDPLFAGLFPQQNEPQNAPQTPEAPKPGVESAPAPIAAPEPSAAPQPSEADQLRAEYDAYRQQVESLSPITRYITENPDLAREVFGLVEQRLSGRQQEPAQEEQPPAAPERPAAYNEADAYTDPTSESWAFRVKMEAYRDQMSEYRVRQAERRVEALQGLLDRQREEAEQAQQLQQIYQFALSKGASHEEAQKYVHFVTNRKASQDDIWDLFMMRNQATLQRNGVHMDVQSTTKPAASPARQPLNIPLPSAAASGAAAPQLTPSQQVFEGILALEKRSDPFT